MSDSIPPNDPQQLGPWLRRFEHPAGLRWVARDGALRIDRQPALDDQGAAALPTTAGEHRLALRYLNELLQAARQQDNQLRGGPFDKLSSAADEAVALLDGPTEGLLERLPELLASTQDVVSFIDLDERQGAGERLEPELKRLLTRASSQLVVLATGFPYVNARLSALQEFRSAIDLAAARQEHRALAEAELLEPEDARLLEQQARVSEREGVQGARAGKGQFFTLRNFMLVALSWTALEVGKTFITGVMEKSERVQAAQLWVARRIVDDGLDSAGRLLAGLPDGIAALLRGLSRDIVEGKPPLAVAQPPRRPEEEMGPPPGFDMDEVKRMILAGVAPPTAWWAHIKELDFFEEIEFWNLTPLAGLTSLERLELGRTDVDDLRPLAGLIALRTLNLWATHVRDISPIAELRNLQNLNLFNTKVTNLAPLTKLEFLRTLDLSNTSVSNLAALSDLNSLQNLSLSDTEISDISPLKGLPALQKLDLSINIISDLVPLAELIMLQNLDLRGTHVSDLAPIARLIKLQSLYLGHTQVQDVLPLASMNALQSLELTGARIGNVTPLANLKSLQNLYLGDTLISDVGPIAQLNMLKHLSLRNTLINDISPLATIPTLRTLNLAATKVTDLAPLAGLSALQRVDLTNTDVGDLAPLAGLTALRINLDPQQSIHDNNAKLLTVAEAQAELDRRHKPH